MWTIDIEIICMAYAITQMNHVIQWIIVHMNLKHEYDKKNHVIEWITMLGVCLI